MDGDVLYDKVMMSRLLNANGENILVDERSTRRRTGQDLL